MTSEADIPSNVESRLRNPPHESGAFDCVPFGIDENSESRYPIRIYLYADVLEEIAFASTYEGSAAVAVLTGGFGFDPPSGFIEATGFDGLRSVPLSERYDVLRETCDSFLRESLDSPDVVVGMFASEPGCEGRMTSEMARLHLSLFNVPFQPLVVFDPDNRVLGVYIRPPQSTFFNSSFWVVRSAEE